MHTLRLVMALLLALTTAAPAQDEAPGEYAPPTRAEIQAIVDEANEAELDEDTLAAVEDACSKAEQALTEAADHANTITEFKQRAADAPQRLASIRAELDAPVVDPSPEVPEDATLVQIEQLASQAQSQLAAARSAAEEIQRESSRRTERRSELNAEIPGRQQALNDLTEALAQSPPDDLNPLVARAREALARARRHAAARAVERAQTELASYDARQDLLPARRDRARRRIAEAEALESAWGEIVKTARREDAERRAVEAQRQREQAARRHAVLQEFAADTADAATLRASEDGIPSKISRARDDMGLVRQELASIREQFIAIQRRMSAAGGLNRATGHLLRRHYETLREVDEIRREIKTNRRRLEQTEYGLIDREDQRLAAGDIDAIVRELMDTIGRGQPNEAELQAVARELAVARRDLLDTLVSDSQSYAEILFQLDTIAHDLLRATVAYEDFIEERIMWVRSSEDSMPTPSQMRATWRWLVDAGSWRTAIGNSTETLLNHTPAAAGLITLVLVSLVVRRISRRHLRRYAEKIRSAQTDAFRYTAKALAFTLLSTLPIPVTLWTIGWALDMPEGQVDVAVAIGFGLKTTAREILVLVFLLEVCRPFGLAHAHFRWSEDATRFLRRIVRVFLPITIVLTTLIVAIDWHVGEAYDGTGPRVLYCLQFLAGAIVIQQIFRPRGPVFSAVFEINKGLLYRLRWIWYPALIMLPLGLAIAVWVGHYYTAMQLAQQVGGTLDLILVLVLVQSALVRWLYVTRRRLAAAEAQRKREEEAEPSEKAAGSLPPIDEEALDLPAISAQARELFRAAIGLAFLIGIWVIWADMLPALRALDRAQLYPTMEWIADDSDDVLAVFESIGSLSAPTPEAPAQAPAETEEPKSSTSSPTTPMLPVPGMPQSTESERLSDAESLTLADIGLSIVFLIATWVAFRNFPGFIEVTVLQHLPLAAGSRYALSTVFKYLIAIIGVSLALSELGLSWGKIQFLAAALTFGLAFGLQEIVANFISGLILLAEQPFRIGDTVTVGQVSGTVTKIRMRATTIADWDRKELIIPNKTFITGDVINWTLTDPVLRVTIPIGVKYGADPDRVQSVLMQIAESNEHVMDDPKPRALFLNFSDNSMDFKLYVFVPHISHLLTVKHELHRAITSAFADEGISIAPPRLELNVSDQVRRRADLPPDQRS